MLAKNKNILIILTIVTIGTLFGGFLVIYATDETDSHIKSAKQSLTSFQTSAQLRVLTMKLSPNRKSPFSG